MSEAENDSIRQNVRSHYAKIATSESSCCCGSNNGCCSSSPDNSRSLGYSGEELSAVPDGANLGLGCGNPQTIASIKPGETVLDLGSGAGLDCFLASRQTGADGKVIGVDMTPDMISKARNNARKATVSNVEFRLGEIEHLPVADSTVDVIISNCVINLSPDKQQVFREAYRVLRSGGRIAISDVIGMGVLPDKLKTDPAYCGCVTGAAQKQEIEEMLYAAGFTEINVDIKEESKEFIRNWIPDSGVEAFIRSAFITASKK